MNDQVLPRASDTPPKAMKSGHQQRLPALDGLRAISIVLVVLGHLVGTRNMPLPKTSIAGSFAEFGVRVFFVISGFLITTLLFAEHDRTGTVSLRDFYVRRTYRIFPAFYAYLAVIAACAGLQLFELMDGDLLAGATYTMNFHRPRSWYLGHLWSLSVEEQFYLLWPAVLVVLKKRRALIVAALAIVAAPVIRVAVWTLMPSHRLGIGETFPTVFDALAAGCLLAGLRGHLAANRTYVALSRSPLFVVVPMTAVAAIFVPRVSFELSMGHTIQNVGIALTVDWATRCHDTRLARGVARVLEAPPLVWVGRLSYSIYLWQQPFVNRAGTHWLQSFPFNLAAGLGVAVLSYYFVEQPFLRLRDRRARARKALARGAPQVSHRTAQENVER
jgi:peptidoglycan/LPS O-acetylase OafA/YrhL